MKNVAKVTICKVCNHKLKKVIDFGKTPIGDHYYKNKKKILKKYNLDFLICPNCICGFIGTVVDPEILYDKQFTYKTINSPGLVNHFKKLYQEIVKKINLNKSDVVVEIGSNDGTLISFFSKKAKAIGVDPASYAMKDSFKKKIISINDFFNKKTSEKILYNYGKSKIIICNNTIANISDLDDFFTNVKKIIKKDGYFVFETLSLYKILSNNLFDNIYHEHLYYFSARSLEKLFKKHGFTLVSLKYISSKGGSYRGYAKYTNTIKNDVRLIKSEGSYNKHLKLVYKLKKVLKNYKLILEKDLKNLRNKNYLIYGYGASVGSTTFISHLKIGKMLNFLVDDNKEKLNKYSPEHKIKVLNLNKINQSKNIAFLLISWRYKKIILNKIKKKIKKFKLIKTFPYVK